MTRRLFAQTFLRIALCLLPIGAIAQPSDCAQFHTGKFEHIEDGQVKGTIIRKKSRQTEIYGEKKLVCKVEWLSDCAYDLILIDAKKAYSKSKAQKLEGQVIHVRITRTEGNACWIRAEMDGIKGFAPEMCMVKVK